MSVLPSASTSRRRRLVRTALGTTLTVAMVTCGLAYRHYTDPVYIRAAAKAAMERIIGGRCSIGAASFSLRSGVRLTDVVIIPAVGEPVFFCREVNAAHEPLALFGGEFRLTAITAIEPTLKIVYDDATGQSNLAGLFATPSDPVERRGSWPTVELRDASIQLSRRGAGVDRLVESLNLTVRGRVSDAGPSKYDVVWHDERDDRSGHSQVELSSGLLRNVTGGLPAMSLESVALAVASEYDAATAWGDLLGLTGKVRVTDYNLIESPQSPRSATLSLQDASLSIPTSAEEREVPPDQRYFAFRGVSGGVLLTPEAVTATFAGSLRGSECSVAATIRRAGDEWASLREVGLEGTIGLRSLHLPRGDSDAPIEERRFFEAWPQLLSFQQDYDPRGPVDLDISLSKDPGEDHIQVRRATLTLRGGEASARWFPYQGRNMRGTVEYSPEGVDIKDVCGEHEGGTACVNGHFDKPNKCSPAQMRILGERIPVDEHLLNGLEARYRRIVDPFDIDVPLSVDVQLRRGACQGAKYEPFEWTGEIAFSDATLRHERLAFPMTEAKATFRVTAQRIEDMWLRAKIGGQPIQLVGDVFFFEEGRHHGFYRASLTDIEPAAELLSMLPPTVADWVNGLHPSGRLDALVGLESEDNGGLTFTSAELQLRSMAFEPDAFPIPIRSLEGPVSVGPTGVTVGPLKGSVTSSSLVVEGDASFGGSRPTYNLNVKSPDLVLGVMLREALPPTIRDSLAAWKLLDPIGVEVHVRDTPPSAELEYEVTAQLRGVTIEHEDLPQPLQNVRGSLIADAGGVRSKDLTLDYAGASASVDFRFAHDAMGTNGAVEIVAGDVTLDDAKREALPTGLRTMWDRAVPRGVVDLDSVRLRYSEPADGMPRWTIDADAGFRGLSLPGLAEVDQIDGRVAFTGDLLDDRGGISLGGELRLDSMQLSGRPLTTITAPWTLSRDGKGSLALNFPDARGELFGGTVGGQFVVTSDDRGTLYSSSAMVYGMSLAPWIDAGRRRAPEVLEGSAEYKPSQVRGRVNLTLSLSGEVGDAASRRGAGQIEIREGYIYRLPVLMAVLNVVNVSLPKEDFVHDAEATFYLVGNQLSLEAIQMQGGPLTLLGSGSVSLPDQAVDLRLYASSTTALSHVPLISDIIEGTTKELIELRVTGPISRPTVRPTPFRGVSEELSRLFQKKERKPLTPSGK